MIDIEFVYFWQCGNSFDVMVGQVMICIYFQFQMGCQGCGVGNMCQFFCLFCIGFCVGVVVGMDFDKWCVDFCCCVDLCFIGIDKE